MQQEPIAEIVMDLGHTVNRNKKGSADAEITIGVKHVIQFVHGIVHHEFSVVVCLKEIEPAITKEIGDVTHFHRYQLLSVLPRRKM